MILILCHAVSILADTCEQPSDTNSGYSLGLQTIPLAEGGDVSNNIYENCKQRYKENGTVISEGPECVQNALDDMIRLLDAAHDDNGEFVVVLNADTKNLERRGNSTVPSQSATAVDKGEKQDDLEPRSPIANETFLSNMNERLFRRTANKHNVRAVELSHSDVYPGDGMAIRTNVRSGNATLHVHKNRFYGTAAFEADAIPTVDRRDVLPSGENEYEFEGAQGLKMQVRWLGERGKLSDSRLCFGIFGSYTYDGMGPAFRTSDAWAFAGCHWDDDSDSDSDNDKMIFQGKVVALGDGAGDNFEYDGLVDCGTE
jgi:hypothetical protein